MLSDIFTFDPNYVGGGIAAVKEETLDANTTLTNTQKYFYEKAKIFHNKTESDGYVYQWIPLSFLVPLFEGQYPRDTTTNNLEIKILENPNLTTKNLFIKYQKSDSTHFSDKTAVGSSDKINIDDIVCKVKIDRIRLESINYTNIFKTELEKYNNEHMNEGITISEGIDLTHKEVSINANQIDTDFINVDVANFESSGMIVLNMFPDDFPFKNSINTEPYVTSILRNTKKNSAKVFRYIR